MGGVFETREGGGAVVALDGIEISILRSLAVQLLELIGPGEPEPAADADPLAVLFASDGPTEPPPTRHWPGSSPTPTGAPARPRGRARRSCGRARRSSAASPRTTCAPASGRTRWPSSAASTGSPGRRGAALLELTDELPLRWLGALNDLRLTIAARLDITEDDESAVLFRLPDDDPRKPMVMAYLWLGGLQETLIETL